MCHISPVLPLLCLHFQTRTLLAVETNGQTWSECGKWSQLEVNIIKNVCFYHCQSEEVIRKIIFFNNLFNIILQVRTFTCTSVYYSLKTMQLQKNSSLKLEKLLIEWGNMNEYEWLLRIWLSSLCLLLHTQLWGLFIPVFQVGLCLGCNWKLPCSSATFWNIKWAELAINSYLMLCSTGCTNNSHWITSILK